MTKSILISSTARAAGIALVVAAAISGAQPAAAASGLSTAQIASSATDISAARRHHARRAASRNAFGSIVDGPATYAPLSQGYGYGVGDNSRNQTW